MPFAGRPLTVRRVSIYSSETCGTFFDSRKKTLWSLAQLVISCHSGVSESHNSHLSARHIIYIYIYIFLAGGGDSSGRDGEAGHGDQMNMLKNYAGRVLVHMGRAGYEAIGDYLAAIAPTAQTRLTVSSL